MYTNELIFDETDDHVRDLLQHQSIDRILAKRLLSSTASTRGKEWGWHNLSLDDDSSSADHDSRSVGSSAHSSHATTLTVRSPTAHTASSVAKASPRANKTLPLRETPPRGPSGSGATISYPGRAAGEGPHPARRVSGVEPHPHPCEEPVPACALSIYMLAHRYRLDTLTELAKGHILDHLTPSTCVPVLSVPSFHVVNRPPCGSTLKR